MRSEDEYDIVIEPAKTSRAYLPELWNFRELFLILAWRDFVVRYKETVAGIAWAVIQPVATLAVATLAFSRVAELPSIEGVPYVLLILVGVLPWQLFSAACSSSGQSILANQSLITKVYFPRLILPASAFVVSLIEFAIASLLLVGLLMWFSLWPGWRMVFVPLLVVYAVLAAFGPALLIAAMTVRYRDVRFVVPLLLQLGFFISPIAYRTELVAERMGEVILVIYALNPLVGVVDGLRWALLDSEDPTISTTLPVSLASTLIIFLFALHYFLRTERSYFDRL